MRVWVVLRRFSMAAEMPGRFTWLNMKGSKGRSNDVLHYSSLEPTKNGKLNVLYFPGDVQEREDVMASGPNKEWTPFSYEATARKLDKRFCDAESIFIVRPARFVKQTFSCFDNFVANGIVGAPDHASSFGAWSHVLDLISGLEREVESASGLPWTFVGFSKGCVVLNQLCFEMAAIENLKDKESSPDVDGVLQGVYEKARTQLGDHKGEFVERLFDFYRRLKAFYWLDGGHSGEGNTWVTGEETLKVVAQQGLVIQVHVTPYQMKDKARPWLEKEETEFVATLKKCGADVTEKVYFADKKRCLGFHFEILDCF